MEVILSEHVDYLGRRGDVVKVAAGYARNYGSADISHALQAKGFEIEKRKIHLPEPLKALGESVVPVKIHRDVTAQVRVKVVAE